jgi:hypothetical protein
MCPIIARQYPQRSTFPIIPISELSKDKHCSKIGASLKAESPEPIDWCFGLGGKKPESCKNLRHYGRSTCTNLTEIKFLKRLVRRKVQRKWFLAFLFSSPSHGVKLLKKC